jgi:RNA polymerase sigma factor (sigma-70 family)
VASRLAPTLAQDGDAEEITQQVLVALLDGLSRISIRTERGVRSFLEGVVSHKVADFLRARGNGNGNRIRSLESTVLGRTHAGPLWQFLSASGASPRTMLEHLENRRKILCVFDQLSADDQELLNLAIVERRSVVEIATRMQLSRHEAARRVLLALATLRKSWSAPNGDGA